MLSVTFFCGLWMSFFYKKNCWYKKEIRFFLNFLNGMWFQMLPLSLMSAFSIDIAHWSRLSYEKRPSWVLHEHILNKFRRLLVFREIFVFFFYCRLYHLRLSNLVLSVSISLVLFFRCCLNGFFCYMYILWCGLISSHIFFFCGI